MKPINKHIQKIEISSIDFLKKQTSYYDSIYYCNKNIQYMSKETFKECFVFLLKKFPQHKNRIFDAFEIGALFNDAPYMLEIVDKYSILK